MKKLKHIFSFLNKKGVFALGLVLGIVLVLFFGNFVFAETSAASYVLVDADCIYSKNGTDITKSYGFKISVSDPNYLTKYAGVLKTGSTVAGITCNTVGVISLNSSTFEIERDGTLSTVTGTSYSTDTSVLSYTANIYIFSTSQMAELYLNGEIDATSALNYEEVQNNSIVFDSSIPSLDYAYLQQISETQNIVNFGYNETIPSDVVKYKITVYNYYVQDTTIYDLAFTLVGAQVKRFDKFYENGLLRTDLRTVQERMQEVTILTDMEFFMDEEQKTFVDTMYLQNVVKLPDYNTFDKFQYFACRVEIVPVTSDGRYGNKVIVSGTISDVHNSLMGTNFVKESSDSTGQVIQSTPQGVTNTGQFTSSGLNTDNLLSYFQNGFGLLGNNGFLALARETFSFFPTEIWVLIFFGISVSIVLVVARFGRGL